LIYLILTQFALSWFILLSLLFSWPLIGGQEMSESCESHHLHIYLCHSGVSFRPTLHLSQ
jgi:hypothetical protein